MTEIDYMNVTPTQAQDLKKNYWAYLAISIVGVLCMIANVYLNCRIGFANGFSMQVSMSWLSFITFALNGVVVWWFSKQKSDAYLQVYTHLFVEHLREMAREQMEGKR